MDWLSYIGIIFLSLVAFKILYYILKTLYEHYIGSLLGLNCNLKKFGGWCIITGGTDGIGKCYAFALAKKGIDIILISRNAEKLENTAKEIKEKYNVKTKIVAVDFSDEATIYEKIKTEIKDLHIGILINNVGMIQWPAIFSDIPNREAGVQDLIKINILSCMMMTSTVIEQMVERKNGLILNVSSLVARTPLPGFSVYGSVKSCGEYFSRALTMEYERKGIIVQSVVPGYVATKMSNQRPSFIAPTPETYVNSHLRTIGLCEISNGYIVHTLIDDFVDFCYCYFPDWLRRASLRASAASMLNHFKETKPEVTTTSTPQPLFQQALS